jgi:hypothetical protein
VLKRLHYPLDVMLLCVRWYVAYALSLRNLEEMMAERGIAVDHRRRVEVHLTAKGERLLIRLAALHKAKIKASGWLGGKTLRRYSRFA